MTDSKDVPGSASAESMRAKYLEERDKRLVDRRAELRDFRADPDAARYRRDPFTEYRERDPVSDDEAGGIGGTWYWNRYPGLMCDIESYIYLPMLEELGTIPKNRYAFGDEILAHYQAIADKFDLVNDALFHTRVEKTEWDEASSRWRIRTDHGDELTAKYVVMAVGILNLMKLPAIPGMDDFQGKSFHTARWDYDYTGGNVHGGLTGLEGKRVAVVGAGASGIQTIPHIAASADHLYVFQRTPSAIGVRGNHPT